MIKKMLLASAVAVIPATSLADTMTTVTLSENGGPTSTFSSVPTTGLFNMPFGSWTVFARDSGGPGSSGFEINVFNQVASSLWVTITTQGLTQPTNVAQFLSDFRINATMPAGWTVTEQVWFDPNNGVGFSGVPVTDVFTFAGGPSSLLVSKLLDYGPGPYSMTALFNVYGATPNGQAWSDINVGANPVAPPSEVPLPASLWLFSSGLVGLFVLRRKRRGRPGKAA